jgi:hypothetical protein
VVAFREADPEFTIDPREIEVAHLACEATSPGKRLFSFSFDKCPATFAKEMEPCQYPAFRQNLIFHWLINPNAVLRKGSAGTCNRVRHLPEIVRSSCELAPDFFLQTVVPTETGGLTFRIDPQEVSQDHGDSIRIPEGLVTPSWQVDGKTVQKITKENHVLMFGG